MSTSLLKTGKKKVLTPGCQEQGLLFSTWTITRGEIKMNGTRDIPQAGIIKFAMVQADGLYALERKGARGDAGDAYPGSTNNTSFTSSSFPSSLDYNFNFTNIALKNIAEKNSVVSLDLYVNDNLNPSARNFDLIPHDLTTPADTMYFPVTNTGVENIVVTNITNINNVYKIIPPVLPKTLAANESFKLGVVFNPKTRDLFVDTITITRTNSLLREVKILVKGKGFIQDAAAEKTIYAISGNVNSGNFAVVNKASGAAKNIGISGYGDIISLAVNPKTKLIYGLHQVTADSARLVRINPTLGDAYSIYKVKIGNLFSIVFDTSGTMYGVSKNGNLYKIDFIGGTTSLVATLNATINALAFNPLNNELWGAQFGVTLLRDNVYKINMTTGQCATIGRTGTGFMTKGLFFDESGKLYGVTSVPDTNDNFILIDKATGAATVVGSSGLTGITGMTYLPGKVTDVKNNGVSSPYTFSLMQNYPNPFNPSTTIKYSIPQNGSVKLTVYNLLGQAVKTLVNQNLSSGNYIVNWNSDNEFGLKVSSGIYFYELKFNAENGSSFSDKKKMILVK